MGVVKMSTEAIGMAQLAASWGMKWDVEVLADSSAALAVVARMGNGRLRHVRGRHLWVQEMLSAKDFSLHKGRRDKNMADLLAKHLDRGKLDKLCKMLGYEAMEGVD